MTLTYIQHTDCRWDNFASRQIDMILLLKAVLTLVLSASVTFLSYAMLSCTDITISVKIQNFCSFGDYLSASTWLM